MSGEDITQGEALEAPVGQGSRFMARWDYVEKWIAGGLIMLALCLSFYSVAARYIFHWSLDWSDEISVYMVVWSVFFGASSLMKKDEHVRVDLFIQRVSERRQNILHFYHGILAIAFLVVVTYGGCVLIQKAYQTQITSESYLKFPMYLPYLIMPLGGALLSVRMIERLVMLFGRLKKYTGLWRDPVIYGLIILSIALFYVLRMDIDVTLAMIMVLVIMLFLGMPVGFSLGIASLACLLAFNLIKMDGVAPKMFWAMNKFTLIAIPYFIVAGNLMMKGGLAKPLLALGYSFLKRLDGGLAIAVMFAAVIFSAISGVSAALAATLGLIAIPWMMEKGYPKRFCMGLIGAGGTLDILIPPSTVLIIYGTVSGDSISDLYIAGFLPGFLLAAAMCIQVWFMCRRHGFGQPAPEDKFSWKEVAVKFKEAIWALLMPVLIMGGIYSGVFTVTEASVVSVFYAAVVCIFIYRNIGFKEIVAILNDSVVLTSMIYFILMCATLFGFLVTMEQLSNRLLEIIAAYDLRPWMFLAIMNISIFIMGMFLTPATKILIVVPIVYPILQKLGISGIHFGILMTINMELAFLMPPIGMHLYVMSAVCKEPLNEVVKGVLPFFLLLLVGMFVITYIPWISLVFLKH